MKKITLLTASSTDAGEFRDGGSVLTVGPKADVSAESAADLVATGRAEEYKAETPVPATAE